jgi:hypothetical protein
MKRIFITIALIALLGFSPDKLIKTKVSDGIFISIPEELQAMSPDDIVLRTPSVRAPLAAYSDVNRSLEFSVSVSATQWPDANLELASKFFKSSITNLYDRVDFINEGIKTIHKKQFIFFEFESRVNGNKMIDSERQPVYKYTYIQYLVEPKRTLVFSFNCQRSVREDWQNAVHAMMNSVKVK